MTILHAKEAAVDGAQHITAAGKLAAAGNGLTIGSAAWAWIGANHQQLTVIIALLGLVVTTVGVVLKDRRDRRNGDEK